MNEMNPPGCWYDDEIFTRQKLVTAGYMKPPQFQEKIVMGAYKSPEAEDRLLFDSPQIEQFSEIEKSDWHRKY
jgi:hypothetical protein